MSKYASMFSSNTGSSSATRPTPASDMTHAAEVIPGREAVMVDNYDGGVSFGLCETYENAVRAKDDVLAQRTAKTILGRALVMGTVEARADISASKLTNKTLAKIQSMITNDHTDLIVDEIKRVYSGATAAKMSHAIFVTAILTTVTADVAGSQEKQGNVRRLGYSLVIAMRTASHVSEWASVHKTLQGGTGAGYRKAIAGWFLKLAPHNLAYQCAKYWGGRGSPGAKWSIQDLLRTSHVTPTSANRCKCRGKAACKCPKPAPKELKNLVPVSAQLTLAIVAQDLDHMVQTLEEGIERAQYQLEHKTGRKVDLSDDTLTSDVALREALNVAAYWCAVTEAKDEWTSTDRVVELIRLFRLTRELVSNTKLRETVIMQALTFQDTNNFPTPAEKDSECYALLCKYGHKSMVVLEFARSTIGAGAGKQKAGAVVPRPFVPKNWRVSAPATAAMRNLPSLDEVFQTTHGQALLQMMAAHIGNAELLERAMVHPLALLNAAKVYGSGRGVRGSKRWTVHQSLVDALRTGAMGRLDHAMRPIKSGVAFGMDFSGSMGWDGSVQGMQLTAKEIVMVLVLTFLRGMKRYADENKTTMPPHMVGFFGSWSRGATSTSARAGSVAEAEAFSKDFTDITIKVSPTTSYEKALELTKEGSGCTDIGAFIWHCVAQVRDSLTKLRAGQMKDVIASQVPGVYDALVLLTDNDVNSGHQPAEVLKEYRRCVAQVYRLCPYDDEGKLWNNWRELYDQHVPKFVVLATQGTKVTVGEPTDPHVLNVSGFDLSTPQMIEYFLYGESDAPGADAAEDEE